MENIDNLESVKSIAQTHFKMSLIINAQGFYDEGVLTDRSIFQIFTVGLQVKKSTY